MRSAGRPPPGIQASGLFTASAYTNVQLGVSVTLIILRVEKRRARPSFLYHPPEPKAREPFDEIQGS